MPSLDINSSITLNVARPNSNVVLYAKQFDKLSRTVDVSLINGTEVWDPPQNCEVVVMCFKPDGTKAIFDVANSEAYYDPTKTYSLGDRVRQGNSIYSCNTAITTPEAWNANHWTYIDDTTPAMSWVSAGHYTLTLAEQALSAAGNVLVELSFYSSDTRATTLSFTVNVEKSVPDNTTLESSDYFNVLTGLIQGLLGASTNPPIINPQNYLWQYWNVANNRYEDNPDGLSAQGAQGERGYQGYCVDSIAKTGTQGSNDTYTMYLNDQPSTAVGTFTVHNGIDGSGSPGYTDPLPDDDTASVGTSPSFAHADHVHPLNAEAIANIIYPIGSIYMSMNPTSPTLLFGGDWVRWTDRFLLGAGNNYDLRSEDGEPSHILSEAEMPPHIHTGMRKSVTAGSGNASTWSAIAYNSETPGISSYNVAAPKGGGQPHNNMPPYLAVYIGERVHLIEYDNNMAFTYGSYYVESGNNNIYYCIEDSLGQIATESLDTYVGTFLRLAERW